MLVLSKIKQFFKSAHFGVERVKVKLLKGMKTTIMPMLLQP